MERLKFSIFASTLIALSLNSCRLAEDKPTSELAVETTNLNLKRVGSGILTGNGAEGIGSPKELVIQTEKQWETLRTKMNSVNQSQNEVSIDFEQKTVLAYFDQIRTSGGYEVEIIEVIERTNGVEAMVKFTSPTDMATDIMTQAYHIIAIPKTSKPVKFLALIE